MVIEEQRQRGRPSTYNLHQLGVGDKIFIKAETPADVIRVHKNISQYGKRNGKKFKGLINSATRVIAVARIK